MKKTSAAAALTSALVAGGVAIVAYADVDVRTPVSFDLVTYGVVVVTSAAGGALTNLKNFLDDDQRPHRAVRLLYDLLGAVFVGILTFWICQDNELGLLKTNVIVGLNAFAGVGSIKVLMALLKSKGF